MGWFDFLKKQKPADTTGADEALPPDLPADRPRPVGCTVPDGHQVILDMGGQDPEEGRRALLTELSGRSAVLYACGIP
jgi:hypothetical protein